MRAQRLTKSTRVFLVCHFLIVLAALVPSSAHAAIAWDAQALNADMTPAGSGTQWWFDPANWTAETPATMAMAPPYYLPPNNASGAETDTQINAGTGTLPGGEGVVYDPANDPNFPVIGQNPGNYPFPAGFGAQHIRELYISRQTTTFNLLTIKGDLTMQATVIVGRSSNSVGVPANGRVNQLSGTVKVPLASLDIAGTDTSATAGGNYGNGVYDYQGGILEVSIDGGSGLRLSPSGSPGAAGIGRFIMRNPATPGYVRAYDYNAASGAGNATRPADGVNLGVGISEFHFANGGTRPVQVGRNLIINNGMVTAGTRSARLDLVLDAAPTVDVNGVPQDLGLFDVDFDQTDESSPGVPILGNSTSGDGTLADFFSSADGSTLYSQGATVSAMFAGSTYNWTISYTGNITWADANLSTIASLSDTGGVDVVLKGLSSVIVPSGIAGDYNDNGIVDAADYVVWRKNNGTNNVLPHDPIGGTIDADQYNQWKANFGKTPGSGSALGASAAVPEPGAIVLALVAATGLLAIRRRD